MLNASPVFMISTRGWKRFTLWLAWALSSLGNPSTVQCTVAVLTRGSGSPACTVRAAVVVSVPPGARWTFLLTPTSGSLTVQVRLGLSADEVLVTLIV